MLSRPKAMRLTATGVLESAMPANEHGDQGLQFGLATSGRAIINRPSVGERGGQRETLVQRDDGTAA